MARLKEVRLQRDDFEILKVIGRGAFSEVSLSYGGCSPGREPLYFSCLLLDLEIDE